jgi:glycosyltransferase involved in cell wall biosynthesis
MCLPARHTRQSLKGFLPGFAEIGAADSARGTRRAADVFASAPIEGDSGANVGIREPMKIAQVAPLYESCPPHFYGGTERVVSYLTEELVHQGHEVSLFASGDSITRAVLRPGCVSPLRLASCQDPLVYHLAMLHRVRQSASEFDILHFHTDYLHFPLFADIAEKTLTTLHGRLDLPDLPLMMRQFDTMPLVSISDSQRRPMIWANWYDTVHHGLPEHLYRLGRGASGYLAFVGRISPEKRVDRAIEIARRAGRPLRIAAKVDPVDHVYFERTIEPLLDDPLVDFIGEIGDSDKNAFLGGAAALLFPIDWPEPFGLVLIEAMATGTPVIAFGSGSVPEIIEEGVTGFIVDDVDCAAAAVPLALRLDRQTVRRRFEQRFTAERMALDYVSIYEGLLSAASPIGILEADISRQTAEAAE